MEKGRNAHSSRRELRSSHGARNKPRTGRRGIVISFARRGNASLVQGFVMEIASIQKSLATKAFSQPITMGKARRYEGEPDARKRARPVRWRGKVPSPDGDVLIPLSYQWERKCTYCCKENIPLQIEHIVPRAKGGSNRVSNLCLSCEKCNLAKGTKDIKNFLKKKPDLLKKILTQARAPLKDA